MPISSEVRPTASALFQPNCRSKLGLISIKRPLAFSVITTASGVCWKAWENFSSLLRRAASARLRSVVSRNEASRKAWPSSSMYWLDITPSRICPSRVRSCTSWITGSPLKGAVR
ncbi:hypothetical protein D9M68_884860 [compost metagenome]